MVLKIGPLKELEEIFESPSEIEIARAILKSIPKEVGSWPHLEAQSSTIILMAKKTKGMNDFNNEKSDKKYQKVIDTLKENAYITLQGIANNQGVFSLSESYKI